MGEAVKALEDPGKIDIYKSISSSMDSISKGEFDKIFQIPARAKDKGINELELTDYLLVYLRQRLVEKTVSKENSDIDYLTVGKINDIIEGIMELQSNTKINLNMPLQIENLLLRIQEE
jgi:hypothetical protein